jgi:hypothetical protein
LEVQDKIGISFQTNSIDLVDKKETQLETIKQIKQNKTDTTEIPTGWTSTSHKTFGIQFSHPNDWNVSEVNERTSVNGSLVEMIRVYPEGMDPTIVYFITTQEPLTRARNIALTKSNITESKFNEITLNGHSATQRTDFFTNNDCTQTVTVIEDDNTIYGSEIVECPTHQDRHDQIRIDIADSLEIL